MKVKRWSALGALVALSTAAAVTTATAAAAESLPFQTMTPEDGAVVQQTAYAGVRWTITGGPAAATSIQISVSNTPDVGTDGETLSDLHRVLFVSLWQSSTNVGTFTDVPVGGPYAWTNYPGTYYWQASASWTDTIPDDPNTPAYDPKYISHSALSPIRRITVQAPQPQPQPSAPTTPTASPNPLKMTSVDAQLYVRAFIRQRTHRQPEGLTYDCSRLTISAFRCHPSWRDRRFAYRGTAEFRHRTAGDGQTYALARFDGRRARRSCIRRKSFSRCAVAVHWSNS
jgi:hypothetical protein